MTGLALEISHKKRDSRRIKVLDGTTKDALADYCRHRWPTATAKMAAREFNLTVDEARGVVAGKSSLATYDKIKKAGGWAVIIAVEARVIGQDLDQHLRELRAAHDRQAERLAALSNSWTVRGESGGAPDRLGDAPRERRVVGRRGVG